MPETLEFPPLIEPAELDRAEKHALAEKTIAQQIAVPAPAVPDLTKIDLTDVALAMYGPWRKDVDATRANLSTLALDLSTPAKVTEARSLRARLIAQPLAAARKVAQGIKSKMAATSKAVGAELERIEAAYDEADKLILPKIEEREAELAREREEKAKAEQERKDRHLANIARIRNFAVRADTEPGMTAERIATGIKLLEDTPTPTSATWDEFAVEAANAICETLERMRITHARVLRAEQAEAEAADLRAKLAEQQAATKMDAPPAGPAGDGSQKPDDAAAIPGAEAGSSHPPQGANRDASAEQSHVAEGSTSPTGRGADGPIAGGAAPVSSPTEYPKDGTQQVLKAEPATADATDRAPTSASPCVGTMGAGQAADAAPAGGVPIEQAAAQAERLAPGPITMIEPAASSALPWPNPTDADLADPEFEAIWQVIKSWDISVPGYQGVGYCGGNGSHVMLILSALRAARGQA